MKPVLGMTAEMCRQNAMVCAQALQDTDTPNEGADLGVIGLMWSVLGLLCVAVGDPDSPDRR